MPRMRRPLSLFLVVLPLLVSMATPVRAGDGCDAASVQTHLDAQDRARKSRAKIFRRIAVDRDYSGEYVLHRDDEVTAFLDIGDARHPKFDVRREAHDMGEMKGVPPKRRIHVLVVPNQPREHVAKELGGPIGLADAEALARLLRSADDLAKSMKLKRHRVFVNSERRISIGYLHAHIVGELGPNSVVPPPLRH